MQQCEITIQLKFYNYRHWEEHICCRIFF